MNSMQEVVDISNSMMRATRKDYHLTLGKLISFLEKEGYGFVKTDTNKGLIMAHSYRGHYCDLAFVPDETLSFVSVQDLLKECYKVLQENLEGYKGGEFLMDKDTPLWLSNYGECSNVALVDIHKDPGSSFIYLKTKLIED